MTIAIGIGPATRISLQEYWSGGEPHYTISNRADRSMIIRVCEWQGGTPGKVLAGPWEIPPRNAAAFPVSTNEPSMAGTWAILQKNDELVGLLRPPLKPDGATEEAKSLILTNDGFNGTGEKIRQAWCSQQSLWFGSGGEAEIIWHVPAQHGRLTLPKAERQASAEQVVATNVTCASARVEVFGDVFTIDPAQATRATSLHEVHITCRLPALPFPMIVSVAGRISTVSGGAYPFIRGLLVK